MAEQSSGVVKLGAALGAGTKRQDLADLLLPVFEDEQATSELCANSAIALGLIFAGSGDRAIMERQLTFLREWVERNGFQAKSPFPEIFYVLGVGMICIGCKDGGKVPINHQKWRVMKEDVEVLKVMLEMLCDCCAYAGTGDVLKVQELLHFIADPADGKHKFRKQAMAVLGLAMLCVGDDIGSEMIFRTYSHIMRYSDSTVRRSVPLAMALLSVSNPLLHILETLIKFSHDSDRGAACSSIFAIGLLGAETGDSRVAKTLRQLAAFQS